MTSFKNELHQIQWNFLCGAFEEVFKYPLVAWEDVCKPMEVSGLRTRRIGLFKAWKVVVVLWEGKLLFMASSYSSEIWSG